MAKATTNGYLNEIEKIYLEIPNYGKIPINNLPDISDSKSVVYNTEGIIGRSSPLHTYSYSDTRTISITFHFYVLKKDDIRRNLQFKRAIESCAYPRDRTGNTPFVPPVVCRLRFGDFLSSGHDLCVSLQQYSTKAGTDVAWDKETLCPYKFDMDTTWMVVYPSDDLPHASRIINSGR